MENRSGQTQTKTTGTTTAPPRAAAPVAKQEQKPQGNGKRAAGGGVDLRTFLEKNKSKIAEVASKHLDADRIVRLAALAIHKDKSGQLAEATPISVLQSVMEASRLGLEIGGALGHAYLVAYRDHKSGIVEAQLQVGYRGLIELALRTGKVASVQAHIVWESDDFDYIEGDEPRIFHKPNLEDPRVKWRFVYCIIRLTNGGVLRDVMTYAQVMKIKGRSKSAKSSFSPWTSDEPEMARKTAARRTLKYAPMSSELAEALDHDDEDFVETSVIERTEISRPNTKNLKALVAKNVNGDSAPEEPPPPAEEHVDLHNQDEATEQATEDEEQQAAPANEDETESPESSDEEVAAFDRAFQRK